MVILVGVGVGVGGGGRVNRQQNETGEKLSKHERDNYRTLSFPRSGTSSIQDGKQI